MIAIMNEKISDVVDYLTLSIENNEVTNVDKLTLAINELENFSMTVEILDNSRVGQILQSIRHSKNITIFLSERIRTLIKCWRQLLNTDICSVIPKEIKNTLSKTPAVKNGYTNGYSRDIIINEKDSQTNGFNHSKEEESAASGEIKHIIPENKLNDEVIIRTRNLSDSSKFDENYFPQNDSQNIPNSKIGKPKLKSTKELLADFSNLIESDTKNKILMDRISQEDDNPISYFPKDFKVKELIQLSILQEQRNKTRGLRSRLRTIKRKRLYSSSSSEPDEKVPHFTKCEKLLAQFNDMCSQRPKVVLRQFIPWGNLKRGLQLHPPEIKLPLSQRKRQLSSEGTKENLPTVENPLSITIIDNLLESFEERAKQKQMISEAIQQRKEQTKVVDNTISLVDLSLKLKLKIPKVPVIKLRRKRRKKKKKRKPKPIKIRVKKPRKPYIRPMPPITNYLDDIPPLPPLSCDINYLTLTDTADRPIIECSLENVEKLVYGVFEGYNCTKHCQNSQLFNLTQMYSNIIDKKYLHIFPWIDLPYSARSSFPIGQQELLRSLTEIPEFYS